MGRLMVLAILALIIGATTAGTASANTYYVAANGSDSNNGTSKTTAWLHAPGMPNCTSSCAGASPTGGDSIIFRGGDTWHWGNSSAVPYVGGEWITNPGTSASCQLDETAGAIVKTSCLYIGVDVTWFSGGSFARPILTGDNPTTTGYANPCTYLTETTPGNAIRTKSYTIFDNFEITGECYGVSPNGSWIHINSATEAEVTNCYFHGWSLTTQGGSPHEGWAQIAQEGSTPSHIVLDHNIFDGSDSTDGTYTSTSGGFASGYILGGDVCDIFTFNVSRHVENLCPGGELKSAHDNLIEYIFNSCSMCSGQHGNVFQPPSAGAHQTTVYFYNNITRHVNEGIGTAIDQDGGGTIYFFNNVTYDDTNNCYLIGNQSTGMTNVYVYNNTFGDTSCTFNGFALSNSGNTTYHWQNNHLIGHTSIGGGGFGPTWSTDQGNEVFMTTGTAASQGYTATNNYQPTSTAGATYHVGLNLSLSCLLFSYDSALCNGTTGGVTNTAGTGTIPALYIATPPVRGITFDAGAYQFSPGILGSQPNPPSGLTASVQ